MLMMESKMTQTKKGLNLLHETIYRRLDQTMKTQRAGRMSMLGTSVEALPLSFTGSNFLKKPNAIKLLGKIPQRLHNPPKMAYSQADHPGKYVAKTLNYIIDFRNHSDLVYCLDKRMQNSIKIKYRIILDDDMKPKAALISIYE